MAVGGMTGVDFPAVPRRVQNVRAAQNNAAQLNIRVAKLCVERRSAALILRREQRCVGRVVLDLIGPAVAVVFEIGIQVARVDVRALADAVIEAAGHTGPRAEILVFPNAGAVEPGRTIVDIRHRLEVVDAAPFPVIRAADDEPEPLRGAEAFAESGGFRRVAASAFNGRIAAKAGDLELTLVGSLFGDQVHRAADPVAFHVGLQRFLICTESTRLDGMASNLIWRTPGSSEGRLTPSTVVLVRRGSVLRTCTYLPSPSSRSSVTLGSRPSASARLAFGRLVITWSGITCNRLSAARSSLRASASAEARPVRTMTVSA